MNSLKVRLLLSTLVMTVVMLPIIGLTLTSAFEEQLNLAMKNELKAYSYSIFTVAEVEDKQLLMPELLLENQFNISKSGLYAFITKLPQDKQESDTKNKLLWQSLSLLTLSLPASLPPPDVGQTRLSKINLAGSVHVLYSFSASFSDNGQAFDITLHLIKDQQT
jgi:two-component system sensor histidine kinase PhoQ